MRASTRFVQQLVAAALAIGITALAASSGPALAVSAEPLGVTTPVAVSGTGASPLAACTADDPAAQPGLPISNAETVYFSAVQ